jgi:light-harvesting complex 1 beta chain
LALRQQRQIAVEHFEGGKVMAEDRSGSLSGLTDNEAKEFHGIFVSSFVTFTVIAIVAHALVWMWNPWII